jgi:hypothetical protein
MSILNELCPKVLACNAEFVVTTQEDPVNPYLTTIVCDGIVVAQAAYISKKHSRQVRARRALHCRAVRTLRAARVRDRAPMTERPPRRVEQRCQPVDASGVGGARRWPHARR